MTKFILAATLSLGLVACAPLMTQSPGQGLSPVNAVKIGEDAHVMLFGHDVVSYFTENGHKPGNPAIKSTLKGVTFYFSKPEHKALFDQTPEKYMPQFGGYCANGISYGIPWGGDADTWRIVDGKLYIFGGKTSMAAFTQDVPKNIALANKYWSEEVNGSNAFFQRTKRMVFKVPHYKSDSQVASDVKQDSK